MKLDVTASYRRWLLIWHRQSLLAQVRDVNYMNFLLPWTASEKTAALNTVDLLTSPSVNAFVYYTLTWMNVVYCFCVCKRRRPIRLEVSQSEHRQPQQWLPSHLEVQKFSFMILKTKRIWGYFECSICSTTFRQTVTFGWCFTIWRQPSRFTSALQSVVTNL